MLRSKTCKDSGTACVSTAFIHFIYWNVEKKKKHQKSANTETEETYTSLTNPQIQPKGKEAVPQQFHSTVIYK